MSLRPLFGILILWIAHGGSYSIYYALAVASHEIKIDHRFVFSFFAQAEVNYSQMQIWYIHLCRPDFTNTEPAANIGPFPQWADKKKIVSMDPLGHLAPWLFKDTVEKENGEYMPSLTQESLLICVSWYQANYRYEAPKSVHKIDQLIVTKRSLKLIWRWQYPITVSTKLTWLKLPELEQSVKEGRLWVYHIKKKPPC
jgi:hypothetical protein